MRVGAFAQVLGYLYFARYLAQPWPGPHGRLDRALVAVAFVLFPLSFLVLVLLAVVRWPLAARWRRARGFLAVSLILGGCIYCVATATATGYWQPGIYPSAPRDDCTAAQVWASRYTPAEAQFITPPQIGDQFESGWRVFSNRGTVAALTDLDDILYSPSYLDTRQPRFEAVAPGALARFTGAPATDQAITAQAYYSVGEAQMLAVARQYGASYLVAEKPHWRPWPVAYENATIVIYDLRSVL